MKKHARHRGIDFAQKVKFREHSKASIAECERKFSIYERAIAEVLKGMRTDLGMTQEEFAEKCGLHPTACSRMENCKREPYLRPLFKVSFYTDIKLSTLLKEVERLVDDFEKLHGKNE